jgi:hypothetical protein
VESNEPHNVRSIAEARDAARAINVAQALSETSHKQKRNLIAWAAIALLVHYYDIHLSKIPWLDVDIPEGTSDAGIVIVSLPLIYSFAGFLIYAVSDLVQWQFEFDLKRFRPIWDVLHRLSENLYTVRGQLDDAIRPSHVTPEQSARIIADTMPEVELAVKALKAVQSQGERLTRWKRVVAYGWEFALPLAFGCGALALAVPPLLAELRRLIQHI